MRSHRRLFGPTVIAVCLLACPQIDGQRLQSEGVKDLADQIAASVAKERKAKIGVVSFTELDGRTTVFGRLLAEDLTTKLVNAGAFEVVERAMLDKVFAEMKLAASGVIDAATASRLGRLAGVDALVTGTIADLPSSLAVNCRLIDANTGRILAAAQTKIVKDDEVRAVLGKAMAPGNTPATQTQAPPASNVAVTTQGFQFEVEACTRRSGSVTCKLWITNTRDDRRFQISTGVGVVRFSVFDNEGNEYRGNRIAVGNQKMTALGVNMIAGIRTPALLEVEGNVAGSVLSRISFTAGASDVGFFPVVLKDVDIR